MKKTEEPKEIVSKAEAVRRAIAAGYEAPTDGVAYVMQHFGIEMDNKTFSLNKAQQKSRDVKKVAAMPATSQPIKTNAEMDVFAAMEVMKPIVSMFGVEQTKRMVDVLTPEMQ